MKKRTKALIAVGVSAVILTTFIGATSSSKKKDDVSIGQSTVIPVKTVAPVLGDITLESEYIGKIEPGQQVVVYPKISGEVLTTNFNVGDIVQPGDVLCEIDSKAMRDTIRQTQAAISSAQAKANQNLEMAKKDLETYKYNVENGHNTGIISAEGGVQNAEAALKSAENRLQTATVSLVSARRSQREHRDKDEWDFGGDEDTYDQVSDQLRDAVSQAELAVEAAQIGVDSAKETLKQAKASKDTTSVLLDEQGSNVQDAVEIARLNTNFSDQYVALEKLQDSLNDYTITAPISGIIEQCNVDPFDIASPQSPVYIISNKDMMMVTFNVSSSAAQNIEIGDITTVEIGSASYRGTVTEIGTKVNSVGLFPVKVQINGDHSSLMTGLTVTVTADTDRAKNAVTVPLSLLYFKDNQAYVYVEENGVAVKTDVEIGLMTEDVVEVLSGLDTSSQVISSWSPDLKDGSDVIVTQEE